MNQSTDLQRGQLIGHYELIECVGRGGEATVWSAWDSRINQMTVFKASPRSLDEYSSFQFGREVNLLRHLAHPHILTIHDYGELPGIRYLIARYLPGGTLQQRIPKWGCNYPKCCVSAFRWQRHSTISTVSGSFIVI